MVIDSHCHLDYPGLVDDLEAVLARADAAGIRGLLTIGTRLAAFEGVRTIAERHRQVWCSVGVHPHEAGKEPVDEPGDLIAASDHPKVVGIGESGLDFFYDNAPRDRQETNFRVHIDAARQTGLPLIVHTRDADEATAAVLAEEYAKGPFKGVLHCFTGGAALARAALDIGFAISFSGIVTFKKSEALRAIAADVPAGRLLVETDAPYLAPHPHRGKPNEPAYVRHTLACLAEVRGVDEAVLEAETTDAFFALFSKAERPQ